MAALPSGDSPPAREGSSEGELTAPLPADELVPRQREQHQPTCDDRADAGVRPAEAPEGGADAHAAPPSSMRLYAFTVVPRAPNFCAFRRVSSNLERA
jgi:hypothetical protein